MKKAQKIREDREKAKLLYEQKFGSRKTTVPEQGLPQKTPVAPVASSNVPPITSTISKKDRIQKDRALAKQRYEALKASTPIQSPTAVTTAPPSTNSYGESPLKPKNIARGTPTGGFFGFIRAVWNFLVLTLIPLIAASVVVYFAPPHSWVPSWNGQTTHKLLAAAATFCLVILFVRSVVRGIAFAKK